MVWSLQTIISACSLSWVLFVREVPFEYKFEVFGQYGAWVVGKQICMHLICLCRKILQLMPDLCQTCILWATHILWARRCKKLNFQHTYQKVLIYGFSHLSCGRDTVPIWPDSPILGSLVIIFFMLGSKVILGLQIDILGHHSLGVLGHPHVPFL